MYRGIHEAASHLATHLFSSSQFSRRHVAAASGESAANWRASRCSIGVEVREVNARTPLISVNAKQSMSPASTMKLLTTYAGLELLGPSYSWKTEAYLDGKLEQDVLHGEPDPEGLR